jgi:hypothetical protein
MPIAGDTIISTSANVTSAFCSHTMTMTAVDRAYAAEDDNDRVCEMCFTGMQVQWAGAA